MKQAGVILCSEWSENSKERKKRARLTGTGIGTFRVVALLTKMVAGANLNFSKFISYLLRIFFELLDSTGSKNNRRHHFGRGRIRCSVENTGSKSSSILFFFSGNFTQVMEQWRKISQTWFHQQACLQRTEDGLHTRKTHRIHLLRYFSITRRFL